ncbi:MAG: hypothetical protein RLY15_1298 [Bacteroidota bacterium]|jgi:hypothetical protein
MDVYRLPIHLRNFYYKQLADAKKQESESTKKTSETPKIPKGPNINVRK